MKTRLIHPLWVHIPALLTILIAVFFMMRALPLPESVPTHFDINGTPNGYGSPWMSGALFIGLSVGFLLLSAWLDELWARQETVKRFNWISLFDDLVIASLCGVEIAYFNMLASGNYVFTFPWMHVVLLSVIMLGVAVIMETRRPYRRYQAAVVNVETLQASEELNRIVESGQPVAYWESQNPAYVGGLSIVIPVIMLIAAYFSWESLPWLSVIMVILGIGIFTFYGGFRTLVTRDAVRVKMGIFGFKLLSLRVSDIQDAGVHSFAPIRDFGGYGIRFNQEMQAYFLRGEKGVKITTRDGKKYLIGSDHAERLSMVVKAVLNADIP